MSYNNFINKKRKGAAALITLIILSTFLLVTGITLTLNSIDLNKSLKGFRSTENLYILSRSCSEDALSRLRSNMSYTGTISIVNGSSTCQATVSVDGSNVNYKDIAVSVNDGEFYFNDKIIVDISQSPIVIVQSGS